MGFEGGARSHGGRLDPCAFVNHCLELVDPEPDAHCNTFVSPLGGWASGGPGGCAVGGTLGFGGGRLARERLPFRLQPKR